MSNMGFAEAFCSGTGGRPELPGCAALKGIGLRQQKKFDLNVVGACARRLAGCSGGSKMCQSKKLPKC